MIKIFVNGQEVNLPKDTTLITALSQAGFDVNKAGCAIAVNCEFIPRSRYETTLLKENDVIEVLTAMQGG